MIEEKAILAEPDQNTPRRIAEHILTQQIDITTQQERRVLLAKQLGSQPTILSEALDHKLEDRIDKSQRMYVRTQDRKVSQVFLDHLISTAHFRIGMRS